jgi:uncharacterized membrane protein YtjA (UPF0391 family)
LIWHRTNIRSLPGAMRISFRTTEANDVDFRGVIFCGVKSQSCSRPTRNFPPQARRNLRLRPGLVFQSRRRGQQRRCNRTQEVLKMLGWVVTFLIIALIAGIFGFGGVAGASIEIAKIIFFLAIVLFLVSAIVGLARGRRI